MLMSFLHCCRRKDNLYCKLKCPKSSYKLYFSYHINIDGDESVSYITSCSLHPDFVSRHQFIVSSSLNLLYTIKYSLLTGFTLVKISSFKGKITHCSSLFILATIVPKKHALCSVFVYLKQHFGYTCGAYKLTKNLFNNTRIIMYLTYQR